MMFETQVIEKYKLKVYKTADLRNLHRFSYKKKNVQGHGKLRNANNALKNNTEVYNQWYFITIGEHHKAARMIWVPFMNKSFTKNAEERLQIVSWILARHM